MNPTRRDALILGLSGLAGAAFYPHSLSAGPVAERIRFRIAFRRALIRLRLRGEITADEHWTYARAARDGWVFEHDGRRGRVIDHLELACADIARASGDFTDDLADWWNRLVAWIVDNWDTILQILLAVLVAMQSS